jgi:hypothetical protein
MQLAQQRGMEARQIARRSLTRRMDGANQGIEGGLDLAPEGLRVW